tara:strand:- start:211 stop:441 length:231 start_codon:yes stop_codon:yes gene_type:complete
MSFNLVVNKLLNNAKEELKNEENLNLLKNDVLKPIVEQIFYLMYPYFIGVSIVFTLVIMMIFVILFLNIKICYSNK